MKLIQKFSMVFAIGGLLSLTACQKKDETKPVPQSPPQQEATETEKQEQKKEAPKENKESLESKKENEQQEAQEDEEKLDTSKVKTESLSVDEGTFLKKVFDTKYESSIRKNKVQNISESDLGLLSTVKINSADQKKINIELSLHLMSQNKIVVLRGMFEDKNSVLTIKSEENKIEALISCADDQCDFVIGYAFLQNEGQNVMLGTFIFKRNEAEYRPVQFPKEEKTETEEQSPPILRAEKHLNEGIQKFGEKIITDLKEKIKKEKSWYSPYAFLINLISERTTLTLGAENKFTFDFKQIFNKNSETTRLKDYDLRFEGTLGTPVSAQDRDQGIEVTWTQVTKNFGFGVYKTNKYVSNRDSESKVRTAYFLFWCGFEGVSVNNVTTQIEKCDYLSSSTLVGDVGEGYILEEEKK